MSETSLNNPIEICKRHGEVKIIDLIKCLNMGEEIFSLNESTDRICYIKQGFV